LFIELTEILRCPRAHAESYLVCVPITMDGRDVARGVVGCPVCHAEFPIVDRVAFFDAPADAPPAATPVAAPEYDAAALEAFLGLEGRGGYVVVVGRAARHAAALARRMEGVQVVAVNPPAGVAASGSFSVVRAAGSLPIKTQHVRGVALGRDAVTAPWLAEASRVLLPGLHLVAEDEAAAPPRVDVLARAGGVLVAEKRAG